MLRPVSFVLLLQRKHEVCEVIAGAMVTGGGPEPWRPVGSVITQ